MENSIAKELIANVDSSEFKSLFKTKPGFHALAMIYNWIIIFSVIFACKYFQTIYLYPLAVLIIGARMHALAVLMHDAAHYRFLKNKKWNDWITNIFTMYPIFTSIEKYRANHLAHHQHLNTDEDPDWVAKLTKREFQFPKTKTEFLTTTFSYLVLYQGVLDAIWFLERYKGAGEKKNVKSDRNYVKIGFYLVLFILLTVFNGWLYFLLFWLVPYLTAFFMFQYIRSVAEHFGELAYKNDLTDSRTVKPSLLEQFFIAPHSVGYHIEHHLYPGVPFYNLKRLHELLMKQNMYKNQAHITEV